MKYDCFHRHKLKKKTLGDIKSTVVQTIQLDGMGNLNQCQNRFQKLVCFQNLN